MRPVRPDGPGHSHSHSYSHAHIPADDEAKAHLIASANHDRLVSIGAQKVRRCETAIARIRLALRILSLLLCSGILIVLGQVVAVYYKHKDYVVAHDQTPDQRLWARGLDMRPTLVLLGASVAATAASAVLCVASFSKAVRRITKVGNVVTVLFAAFGIAVWVAAAVYFKVDDLDKTKHYDFLSYTCARRHDKALDNAVGNLGSLCGQMRAAWWGALAEGVLEIVSLATVVRAWWVGREGERYRRLGGRGWGWGVGE
ncbi:uncharacterized protein BDZ99DRAFT_565650 [Mytilinidion resinicola]|uniref:MARVEL domain-containing protein n=1 Tax=Mytilinidion resinicola TaxID=574789 RepID=A0A6A6Z3V7_9PEZI|nr:uncharacterized protein BDZ99DRAFT_565650 [Mytilinidion resinicola]KAF2815710.1 hypothetical protein BDZ99DRAFT_565650 [Mytilinidion resinicola]